MHLSHKYMGKCRQNFQSVNEIFLVLNLAVVPKNQYLLEFPVRNDGYYSENVRKVKVYPVSSETRYNWDGFQHFIVHKQTLDLAKILSNLHLSTLFPPYSFDIRYYK